jgi:hypothetical protein
MLVEHMEAMRRVAGTEHPNTLQKVEFLPKFTTELIKAIISFSVSRRRAALAEHARGLHRLVVITFVLVSTTTQYF